MLESHVSSTEGRNVRGRLAAVIPLIVASELLFLEVIAVNASILYPPGHFKHDENLQGPHMMQICAVSILDVSVDICLRRLQARDRESSSCRSHRADHDTRVTYIWEWITSAVVMLRH
jgi:hypothetical protein